MVTYTSTQFIQFGLVQLSSVQRSAAQLSTFPFSSVQPSSVQPSRAIQFSPAKYSSFLLSAVRALNCEVCLSLTILGLNCDALSCTELSWT